MGVDTFKRNIRNLKSRIVYSGHIEWLISMTRPKILNQYQRISIEALRTVDFLPSTLATRESVITNGRIYSQLVHKSNSILYVPMERYLTRMVNMDELNAIQTGTILLALPAKFSDSMLYVDGRMLLRGVSGVDAVPRLVFNQSEISIPTQWMDEGSWL